MKFVLGVLGVLSFSLASSQRLSDEMKATEEMLAASTKQVNQFFLRFNGEEDKNGKRLNPKDRNFRSPSLRKNYLPNLFDQAGSLDPLLAREFVKLVSDKREPRFLNRRENDWIAEVNVDFVANGRTVSGILYLRLDQQGKGYAWIIEDVAFDHLTKNLEKDPEDHSYFIHPMSHELEFMTLRKAFQKDKNAIQYTQKDYQPDFLSIFLYEVANGNMTFKTVKDVKFHFFVFEEWYFSLANFNRPGYNSGWLINNLFRFENENQKRQLKDYVYSKN